MYERAVAIPRTRIARVPFQAVNHSSNQPAVQADREGSRAGVRFRSRDSPAPTSYDAYATGPSFLTGSKTPFPPPGGTFAPWLLGQHVFSLPLQLAQQRVTSSLLRGSNATIQSDPHPLRLSYDDRCAVESSVAAKILCGIEQLPCSVRRSLGGRRIGTCRASLSQKACLSPQHMQHKSLKFMFQPQHKPYGFVADGPAK